MELVDKQNETNSNAFCVNKSGISWAHDNDFNIYI